MEILNMPKNVEKYKYIVAREVDGEFWFWGGYNKIETAAEVAEEIEGEIFSF